jgi:hypothetical protein
VSFLASASAPALLLHRVVLRRALVRPSLCLSRSRGLVSTGIPGQTLRGVRLRGRVLLLRSLLGSSVRRRAVVSRLDRRGLLRGWGFCYRRRSVTRLGRIAGGDVVRLRDHSVSRRRQQHIPGKAAKRAPLASGTVNCAFTPPKTLAPLEESANVPKFMRRSR